MKSPSNMLVRCSPPNSRMNSTHLTHFTCAADPECHLSEWIFIRFEQNTSYTAWVASSVGSPFVCAEWAPTNAQGWKIAHAKRDSHALKILYSVSSSWLLLLSLWYTYTHIIVCAFLLTNSCRNRKQNLTKCTVSRVDIAHTRAIVVQQPLKQSISNGS